MYIVVPIFWPECCWTTTKTARPQPETLRKEIYVVFIVRINVNTDMRVYIYLCIGVRIFGRGVGEPLDETQNVAPYARNSPRGGIHRYTYKHVCVDTIYTTYRCTYILAAASTNRWTKRKTSRPTHAIRQKEVYNVYIVYTYIDTDMRV